MIRKIRKFIKLLKTPKILIRMLIHRISWILLKDVLLGFPKHSELIKKMRNEFKKNDNIVIFPSPNCPWGYMFQRPQQLARAFAKEGMKIIYMVDTSFPHEPDWSIRGLVEIEPNIYLYNDNHNGEFIAEGLNSKNIITWQYWPHQHDVVKAIIGAISTVSVYDCIDHISTFTQYEQIEKHYEEAIRESNYVIATAKEIYSEILNKRPDCLLLPNAVCIDDFDYEIPMNETKKITIGYYGAIAEWFDFELIRNAANNNFEWTFVIVGEIYPSVQSEAEKLSALNNVRFEPRVNYREIPQLLSTFNVAILPFKLNDITKNTSPVKVFEYLAGGKVTVSTPLPEILELPGVLIADCDNMFQENIRLALKLSEDPNYVQLMKETAKMNSWEKRVESFLQYMDKDCEIIDSKKTNTYL